MATTGDPLPMASEQPAMASQRPAGVGHGRELWPWYLALALVVALVVSVFWWFGAGPRGARPHELPAEAPLSVPLPPATPIAAGDEVAPVEAVPDQTFENAGAAEPAPAPATIAPPAVRRLTKVGAAERDGGRSIFPADEAAIAPPPLTGPSPVVVYHPQRNRGRVVQLGAFPTRVQAEETWSRVTRRYPYLKTRSKMVNMIEVGALGGGRQTRMYRLQLGTSSQAQSVVICQQLEQAGHSCVVVY